jgi:small subunit ribosomal protein S20
MRNSARKHSRNQSVKSRLHNLETSYAKFLSSGKKDEATKTLRELTSALDKAAKRGVIHRARANRSKSRLSVRLNAVKPAPATAPGA